ncbi:MAG TPA: PsiF family protein [Xanthobacteraceae bacterium]|jgi:hypothetical protein|nr:PsiF family protein [Xanthobacteraceae bacterium]
MIKLTSCAIATAFAALLLTGPVSAQSTAPAATAPAAKTTTAPAPKAKSERSAVSVECSKQADAKGLHGKERHKFRATCKKNGGKAG